MTTLRQVFEQVKTHLLTQNEKAYDTGFGCRYVDADGKSCAVGCLIKPSVYNPVMEGKRASDAIVMSALRASIKGIHMNDKFVSMMSKLQEVHDTLPVEEWDNALRRTEELFFGKPKVKHA